jgi:hypothetical protein
MTTPLPPALAVPPAPAAPRKNNPLALTAGILALSSIGVYLLGIIGNAILPGSGSLICSGLGMLMNLVAFVLGIVGIAQLKNHPEQTGKGWAITGIVFGSIILFMVCIIAVLTLLGPIIGNVFSQVNTNLSQ